MSHAPGRTRRPAASSRSRSGDGRAPVAGAPDAAAPETPAPFPSLNVLLFALGARAAYRPVLFSTNEIFCGPDAVNARGPDGRPTGIRTPIGPYDAARVVAAAGARVAPDLVVVKADATGRNFPLNLAAFRCPKVLIVGNTQHLEAPVRRLLSYADQERFDVIVSDHKRHHLHFFVEAGFPKVAWLPALNVNPHRQPVTSDPRRELLFVGQTGKFHPFRNHVLAALKQSGLPLTIAQAPQSQAAALYARAAISLNCSLNGDLNLRVFEVLSSGGLLLTDRLAPEAGLELLFEEGRHFEAYGSLSELIEKARDLLDHPARAAAIARAGAEAFWRDHAPARKAAELMDFVFHGRIPAAYDIARERRAVAIPVCALGPVVARAAIYEALQELQLERPSGRVLVDEAANARIVCDAIDLSRLRFTVTGARGGARLSTLALWREAGVLDRVSWLDEREPEADAAAPWDALVLRAGADAAPAVLSSVVASVLASPAVMVILDVAPGTAPAPALGFDEAFAALGFAASAADARVFTCGSPHLLGQALIDGGDAARALALLAAAAERHPDDADWLTSVALLAIQLGRGDVAETSLCAALAIRPTHAHARAVLTALWRHTGRQDEALRIAELRDLFPRSVDVEPEGALLSPKRILIINNLFPPQELGGYGRLLADLSALLRARGHEVHVLSSDTPYLGAKDDHEPEIERALRLFGGWKNGATETFEAGVVSACAAANVETVEAVIRSFRPDVCLLGNIDFVGYPIIASLLSARVPVLHHLGNPTPGYPIANTPQSPLYRLATASAWLARTVAAAGFVLPRIDVIYPGAQVQDFAAGAPAPRDHLRIAYASIVLPYKGAHVLVDALIDLHRRQVPFTCTIAGTTTDQPFVDKLRADIARAGLADDVSFVGFLDRAGLRRLFHSHNVLAFPTLVDEAFGISQVEAMAAGMVVVSSGTGGASEVVEDEHSGLLRPRGQAAALADALAGLPREPERWRQLAETGQRRVLDFFDIRRSVDQLEATFAELLGVPLDGPAISVPVTEIVSDGNGAAPTLEGGRVEFTVDGVGYRFELSAFKAQALEAARCHRQGALVDEDELRFIRGELGSSAQVVVEVGALVGNHTVFFLKTLNPRKLIAFDADLESVAQTQRNCLLNDGDDIHTDLAILHQSVGGDADVAAGRIQVRGANVEVTTLDAAIEEPVDFIRIAVDGAELAVLAGARTLLARHRPRILVDVGKANLEAFDAFLREVGYVITRRFERPAHVTCFAVSSVSAFAAPGYSFKT